MRHWRESTSRASKKSQRISAGREPRAKGWARPWHNSARTARAPCASRRNEATPADRRVPPKTLDLLIAVYVLDHSAALLTVDARLCDHASQGRPAAAAEPQ